jgi:hypothetical protein
MTRVILALVVVCSIGSAASASDHQISIPDRAKGAETIVVATVVEVTPAFERNAFGDNLIVSHAWLKVEESLKGAAAQVIPLDVEGGTVNGLTMRVSDMEPVSRGDRAVFFIKHSSAGVNVPHLRGHGIVKLDKLNRVCGAANVTLDDVKRQVKDGR